MDLDFKLDKENSKPLYIQLYEKIKMSIEDGEIKPGDKLPPIRTFAKSLDVNNVTIVSAYRELENNGYVYSKTGSGTYVLNIEKQVLKQENPNNIKYDFATAWLSPEFFPVNDFKGALNEVLDEEKGNAFIYDDTEGFEPLRYELSKYLIENEIIANYKNIQIVSGAQQGIDIIAKSLIEKDDVVVVEKPTYVGAVSSFNSRGAKVIDVEITSSGMDIEKLNKMIKNNKPKFIYIMPNFQNPTGICYSDVIKEKILSIARENGCYIVEDDYLSDINFGKGKHKTLKSMDKNDIVIYIKSFSKIFMPGLRLGFMVLPKDLEEDIQKAKYITDISTSGLIQRSFHKYLKNGMWRGQLLKVQKIYKEKYDLMIALMKKHAPNELDFIIPDGGLNMWCSLPKGYKSDIMYVEARKRGINFVPGHLFFLNHSLNQFFRVSFANINIYDMDENVKILCQFISEFLKENKFSEYKDDWFMKFV